MQGRVAWPRTMLNPRHDRHVLAEVAVEEDDARHLGAALVLLAQQRRRAVEAAIVHEHDLVGARERVERRIEAREEGREDGLLVVDRDDDRELRPGHRGACSPGPSWSWRSSS